jgi:hypothetical protein
MKTNRQARLLLIKPFAPREQKVNISNRKRLYYTGGQYYCVNRKLNIGQARWARYRKWVKSLEEF